jgi:hypothetical protein
LAGSTNHLFSDIPALDYMPAINFMPAPLPSLKVNPVGPEGIPDGTCFKHGHAGTYLKLP